MSTAEQQLNEEVTKKIANTNDTEKKIILAFLHGYKMGKTEAKGK